MIAFPNLSLIDCVGRIPGLLQLLECLVAESGQVVRRAVPQISHVLGGNQREDVVDSGHVVGRPQLVPERVIALNRQKYMTEKLIAKQKYQLKTARRSARKIREGCCNTLVSTCFPGFDVRSITACRKLIFAPELPILEYKSNH